MSPAAPAHGLFLALAGLLALAGCAPDPGAPVGGASMGTRWSLRGPGIGAAQRRQVQDHLDAREAVLSHWRPDSALSRFNASRSTDWQPVPPELVRAVALARRVAADTQDALDITCAPLIDLWGFGARPPGAAPGVPDAAAIDQARARCGWRHLGWRENPPALRKTLPELQINVAAVTEGLVLDELAAQLRRQGLRDFLLELGGEVVAAGRAPDGGPWRVGIQAPEAAPGASLQALPLSDQCLSTSGTYRQRFQLPSGGAYSHVIDPRLGRPVQHRLTSVSVLHASAALADGYATALLVLGPEQGRRTAERLGLRAVWIEAAEVPGQNSSQSAGNR